MLLVWSRHDEPVLIVNYYAAPLARRDSWLRRLEIYDDYAESPYARTAEVLTQLGLDRETVGFEKTYLSAARWEEVRGLLPEVRMVDCTEMMARVRWSKTPEEVARFKEAADLLDEAYLEVFPTVVAGETEHDVHSPLVAGCIRRGAQWAHGILNSSRNIVAYEGRRRRKGSTDLSPIDHGHTSGGTSGHGLMDTVTILPHER